VCKVNCEIKPNQKSCHSESKTEKKSCCTSIEEKTDNCCGEKECCFVVKDVLHLENFVSNASIEIKTIIPQSFHLFVLESIYFDAKDVYFSVTSIHKEFQHPYHYNFDLTFKQTWLI